MKKLYLIVALFVLALIGFVSSETQTLGTFKIDSCIDLRQVDNATYCNVSSVSSPNSTIYTLNSDMTKNGVYFNYSGFCNTTESGEYQVSGECDTIPWTYNFYITKTGSDLTISKAVSYILIFVVSFLIFLGLLIYGLAIPAGNDRDEMTGYIISVNNFKYIKLTALGLSYIVGLFMSYFIWIMCYAYLDMDFLASIFQFLFYGLAALTLPLFVLFMYFTIANLVRDSKIEEQLSRGWKVE